MKNATAPPRRHLSRRYALLAGWAVCCLYAATASAQDIHYSQFYRSPLNQNPAYTGAFDGDYRFGLNHRNQWKSVTRPYKTFSGYADMNTALPGSGSSRLGAGLLFNTDKAGDSEYGITQAALSVNWMHALGGDSVHFVSAGVQAGVTQHRINYGNLTFDSQYNGDVFDPALPSNEVFAQDNLLYADFGIGLAYTYRASDRFSLGAGIALFHPLQPKVYFISDQADDARIDRKVSADVHGDIGLTETLYLQPALLLSAQKKFRELNFGGNLKVLLNRKPGRVVNAYLGAFLREGDAVIPTVGLDFNELNVGVSYDINTSDLRRASNSRGGYEVSLTYLIRKVRPVGIKPPCPVY